MKRSEVLTQLQHLQQTIDSAQAEYDSWIEELEYSECDHPEYGDHVCDHCGAYVEYSEEQLKDLDDSNVLIADSTELHYSGLLHHAPMSSQYFFWPEAPEPKEDGDYLDSLESWQTYGLDA